MDRRDFIKSGLLAAAVGAVSGPKAIAREAERQAARDGLSKDILNYNPQMQYRPMGRTGVSVSALGFGMLRLPMKNGHVDFDQTTPMVRRAIEGGVNYIDTELHRHRARLPRRRERAGGGQSPRRRLARPGVCHVQDAVVGDAVG